MRGLGCFVVVVLLGVSGCGLHAVRDLSTAERDYYDKLRARMVVNDNRLALALADLGTIHDHAAEAERDNTLTMMAKAKLLDRLSSSWANVPARQVESQRAVALYSLFELSEAERVVFEAQLAQAADRRRNARAASAQLLALLGEAVNDQKILLEYVNQPKLAEVSAFVDHLVAETQAFQRELAIAQDERLKQLAVKSGGALGHAAEIKDKLESLLKLKNQSPPPPAATSTGAINGEHSALRSAQPR